MKFSTLFPRSVVTIVMSIPMAIINSNLSFAQDFDAVQFSLLNASGTTIEEFYVSPPHSNKWRNDILGTDILSPNNYTIITINDNLPDCLYDVRIVTGNGAELEWSDVSICNSETWIFDGKSLY